MIVEDTPEAQVSFDEKLVELWVQARNEHLGSNWVAKQLRVAPRYVKSRVKYLRAKGVNIPSLQGRQGITSAQAEKLNKIIEGGSEDGK